MTKQKKELPAGKMFLGVINARVEFQEGGKRTRASRFEVMVRHHAAAAVKGDVTAAEMLLKLHQHSKTHGDIKAETIYVPARE
jgi:hypothetical protein